MAFLPYSIFFATNMHMLQQKLTHVSCCTWALNSCPTGMGVETAMKRSRCTFPNQPLHERSTALQPWDSVPCTTGAALWYCLSLFVSLPSSNFLCFHFFLLSSRFIVTGFLLLFAPSYIPWFQKWVEIMGIASCHCAQTLHCCFVLHEEGKAHIPCLLSFPFFNLFSRRTSELVESLV